MKHLKLFNSEIEYNAFRETSDFITPNVSFAKEENKVFYNPYLGDIVTFRYSNDFTDIYNVSKGTTFGEFLDSIGESKDFFYGCTGIRGVNYHRRWSEGDQAWEYGPESWTGESFDEYESLCCRSILNRIIQDGDSYSIFDC